MTDREANVDTDDRAPLLSFPPKNVNTEGESPEAGGTRLL